MAERAIRYAGLQQYASPGFVEQDATRRASTLVAGHPTWLYVLGSLTDRTGRHAIGGKGNEDGEDDV